MTRQALLYTEMVTTGAAIHGDRERLLGFSPEEHPLALQIGGSDPKECARAAKFGEEYGYDEINLNVGCPSDRVQSGRFGACLMAEPATVAACVAEMKSAVKLDVTVKCRIGIDNQDEDRDLDRFVDAVAEAGCKRFIIHARKAWLSGLSPKENRVVPPLNYERVHRLAARRSDLEVIINGGLCDLDSARAQADALGGVMLGRAAYQNPWILSKVDRVFFEKENPVSKRCDVVEKVAEYAENAMRRGAKLHHIARHVLGLYQGQPGARSWRRHLSENMHKDDASPETLLQAASLVGERAEAA